MAASIASTAGRGPTVLALALDAPHHGLLMRWMDEGQLPHLARLRDSSVALDIQSCKQHSNEHSWIPVLTGRRRDNWSHWMDAWDPGRYLFSEASLFNWLQAPVFYALGDRRHVVAFDLSAPVTEGVNGVQVCGFASELNESFPQSQPPGLVQALVERFGPDPKLIAPQRITNGATGREGVSWTVPSCYRPDQMGAFGQALVRSVERRTAACLHLMATEPWDLFIAGWSELHTAGHVMWHLSQPHPLDVLRQPGQADPLLAVYAAVDHSVQQLVEAAGAGAIRVAFTLDATVPDSLENARAVFLPEFLYRWNFPGQAALAPGDAGSPPPAPRLDYREHWKHEIWKLRTPHGEAELESPAAQEARGDPLGWCPGNWYAPLWPRMKAFALPSVADGYVRLNVIGREAQGLVAPEAFGEVCAQLIASLLELVNARTGRPIVREVIRVRHDPFDADPRQPPADLIVVCHEDGAVDVVDSPRIGRIGPVPYFRSSSHQAHGAVLHNVMYASGPGIAGGRSLPGPGRLEDIPATILALLGLAQPPEFDGVARL